MKSSRQPPNFAALVRAFFCERLLNQQNASPHTVTAYRDTFRLLLTFIKPYFFGGFGWNPPVFPREMSVSGGIRVPIVAGTENSSR